MIKYHKSQITVLLYKKEGMNLNQHLQSFHRATSLKDLEDQFNELAKTFLYGGYINVRNQYYIYPRTIEFYYHDEETTNKDLQDPIVYHRNRNGRTVPPFPIGTIHAHASGFDITFEDPNGKYRASALIRAYTVLSFVEKDYKQCYIIPKNGKWEVLDEHSSKDPRKNICTQSTYLYDLMNGFSFGTSDIRWQDDENIHSKPIIKARQNVYKFNDIGEKTKERDTRQWSFTSQELIKKTNN